MSGWAAGSFGACFASSLGGAGDSSLPLVTPFSLALEPGAEAATLDCKPEKAAPMWPMHDNPRSGVWLRSLQEGIVGR